MTGRATTAPAALAGSALALLGLGIDWARPLEFTVPGRVLHARLFLVAAAILGLIAVVQRVHARTAATGAAMSMLVAFGLAVRQMSLPIVSPTALVVVAAAVGAFVIARGAAVRDMRAASDSGG